MLNRRSPKNRQETQDHAGNVPDGVDSFVARLIVGVYNHYMAKVIRISEAEAANDFAALIARVREGAKVIIENGAQPVAVLHAAEPVRRSISECIALAKAHEEETCKAPVLDPDFAKDVEEIVSHRKPWNPPAWE